jgi:hypothetical protein
VEYASPGLVSLYLHWWENHRGTEYAVTQGLYGKAILCHFIRVPSRVARLHCLKFLSHYHEQHFRVNMLQEYSEAFERAKFKCSIQGE